MATGMMTATTTDTKTENRIRSIINPIMENTKDGTRIIMDMEMAITKTDKRKDPESFRAFLYPVANRVDIHPGAN